MLIVIRHGSTKLNGESGDDKMRGWLDIPLSNEGKKEAFDTAERLKQLPIRSNNLYSSPLKRALQTATPISSETGSTIIPTNSLKDWNIGEFEGKNVKDVLPLVHHFLDNPSLTVPNGESYSSFYDRVQPFLKNLVESDQPHIAVTHNRITTLLKALSKTTGKYPDLNTLKRKGPIDPGGIMAIHPDWSINILHGKSSQED